MASEASSTVVDAREGFRRWAQSYDQTPNPLLALEERIVSPLLLPVAGKLVVDVGCGTGRWLQRLQGDGAIVVGVDASPEMLRCARDKLVAPAGVICASCTRLPLRGATADIVLCSFTVGYIASLEELACEVARVARPGAQILISDFHPAAHLRGWRRSFRAGDEELEISNFVHDLASLTRAFCNAGLELVGMHEEALAEPERPIFTASGKEHSFAAASAGPAVFVAHMRRPDLPSRRRQGVSTALTITGARIATGALNADARDITIAHGRVNPSGPAASSMRLDLSGYLLLPGLINAHDHLEFNLFPRLGNGEYASAAEWAADIHHREEAPIREHRAVPKHVRLWWGALKNLLAGVTTVCHHNAYDQPSLATLPVRVLRQYGWAHSLAFEPDIEQAFRATPDGAPFIIHLGEGTCPELEDEIFELDRRGCLGPNTVIVHGVSLTQEGRALLRKRGAALVWCPSSNLFTLGRTLTPEALSECGRVALGSDSALTGAGDLLDEIQFAHLAGVSNEQLYAFVTTAAADLLRLIEGEGTIAAGGVADIVAVRDVGATPADTLARASHTSIEVVVLGGELQLITSELAAQWPYPLAGFEEINVNGSRRLVKAPVAELLRATRDQLGPAVRLAGKAVAQ